jgi:3-oxoadipate enol-lactonase
VSGPKVRPSLRTRDGAIAYDVEGDRGPCVLLIMGYGMRGVTWRTQIEELSKRYRVAYFDNRGVGESVAIAPREWTMRDMAKDSLAVLDALGWERAHVIGVSMGGMIAMELALEHPRRCASLSLIVTHAGGPLAWLPTPAGLAVLARTQLARSLERRHRIHMELHYPAHFIATVDPGEMARRIAEAGDPTPDTARKHLRAIQTFRARSRLGALRLPTLVVQAALDRLVLPRHSDDLVRLIPGAELARFDDAGHGVIFQRGVDVSERLHRHLAKVESPTARAASFAAAPPSSPT